MKGSFVYSSFLLTRNTSKAIQSQRAIKSKETAETVSDQLLSVNAGNTISIRVYENLHIFRALSREKNLFLELNLKRHRILHKSHSHLLNTDLISRFLSQEQSALTRECCLRRWQFRISRNRLFTEDLRTNICSPWCTEWNAIVFFQPIYTRTYRIFLVDLFASEKAKNKMELEIWHIVVIAVGGAVLLGILIGICYCCCKKKSVEKSTSQETLANNRTLSPRNSQVILESGNDDFKPKVSSLIQLQYFKQWKRSKKPLPNLLWLIFSVRPSSRSVRFQVISSGFAIAPIISWL